MSCKISVKSVKKSLRSEWPNTYRSKDKKIQYGHQTANLQDIKKFKRQALRLHKVPMPWKKFEEIGQAISEILVAKDLQKQRWKIQNGHQTAILKDIKKFKRQALSLHYVPTPCKNSRKSVKPSLRSVWPQSYRSKDEKKSNLAARRPFCKILKILKTGIKILLSTIAMQNFNVIGQAISDILFAKDIQKQRRKIQYGHQTAIFEDIEKF